MIAFAAIISSNIPLTSHSLHVSLSRNQDVKASYYSPEEDRRRREGATILYSPPIGSLFARVVLRYNILVRAFHPTDIPLRLASNRLLNVRVRESFLFLLERDPGLVNELHPAFLRNVNRWQRWAIEHDRVQCRRIHLHAELVSRGNTHVNFLVAGTVLRLLLLLGAKCVLGPLSKMRGDGGRVVAVEER